MKLALLFAAPALLAAPALAQNRLGPAGSSLGTAFTETCEQPTAIVVRSGWWIDGLRVDCGGRPGQQRGGSGGSENVFALEPGERIRAVSGTFQGVEGEYVYSIRIHTDRRTSPEFGNAGPNRGRRPFLFAVPDNERFGGLFGTYGDFLHSLGVITVGAAQAPVATVMTDPPPKPPLTSATPATPATPATARTPIDVPSGRMGCPSNGRRCQGMRAGDEWEGSSGGVFVTGAEAVGRLRGAPLFACRIYFAAPSPYYYSSVFGYVAEESGCVVNDAGEVVIGRQYEVFLRNPADRTTTWIAERGGTFSLDRIGICRVTAANGVFPGHIVEGRGCAVVVNGSAVMADSYETMSVR